MYAIDLSGKNGVIFGVANHRSIAWAIAQTLAKAGARLAITHQNERLREQVGKLVSTLDGSILLECDVGRDENVAKVFRDVGDRMGEISFVVHSIAFANRDNLGGNFSDTDREGFRTAMEISAYSLVPVARYAVPLMSEGGSIIAMTFQASARVFPGYNVMGTAKAALENEVKQLGAELGERGIRVNAISAGPMDTLAARGIRGFTHMKRAFVERAPLRRNITSAEIGKTALYLCSDLSSGVTGAVIPVDAGYHVMGV